ncbi:hypothetical protein L5515_013801 [Caenorhabditis briggsae]|uniref:RING-type E3 ubiquitin transferase n=2 Tax=Caenorhabditis briggsae TaxID=6238 RepID=A0AAE9J749_CAEBR|nr:hypothetical protein L5515_013801 [Caenorhabditis briggsae]
MNNLLQNLLVMSDGAAKSPDEGKNNNQNKNRNQGGNRGRGGSNNKKHGSSRQAPRQPTKVDMKKYERMISAAHTNFSDIPCGTKSVDCDICCKKNDVFGIGPCRHPVCAECVIRMRVLGNSKTCPVCRADIDELSFCTVDDDLASVSLNFKKSGHPDEDRFGIRFSNKVAGTKYEKYLAHVCKICKTDDGERLEFPSFMSLRQHMANRHEQSYCHICTDNLNLFSRERKTYTRDQLQRHMRSGDFDDKSFKGHPQCLFCEQKFLDEENRYRHLRKEHFFCQFCESDGTMTNVFFGKHDELKRHYKDHHYICETEECKQMGIAFANKFELDLHRANEHSERRNLIELGFGQRPPVDTARPVGRGRGAPRYNEPPPPVPRERIAVVQRQVETNPQSDPSEFTTVRSAQSKGVFTSTRSAFTPSQVDFPSLAPQAPPPSIRSSEFPRLNKVNKPAAAAPTVVDHFPSLGETSSSSALPLRIKVPPLVKKRQPPPPTENKPKQAPSRKQTPREDTDDYSRRDIPQTVLKVNNRTMSFDTVDDRPVTTAKSKIQMIQRVEQNTNQSSSSSAKAPRMLDFPSLPAASVPLPPANSSWLNSKNSKIKSSGAISSVVVPANYSKATQNQNKKKNKVSVPKTEVWSSLGPAPETVPSAVVTDEWQDIPLSKEAQAEKEKQEKKVEWARRKAEIQARVAAATKEKLEADQSEVEPEPEVQRSVTPPAAQNPKITDNKSSEWFVANSKTSAKQGDASSMAPSTQKNKNKKNKNKGSAASNSIQQDSAPPGIAEQPPKVQQTKKVESVVPEPAKDSYQEKMDALWNMPKLPSMTSMLSSFSISNIFGMGASTAEPSVNAAPPPGLENVVLTPPPGLGFPTATSSNEISFASAPMLSHDDVREKRERMNEDRRRKQEETEKKDDGWVTTGKTANNKKNKKK